MKNCADACGSLWLRHTIYNNIAPYRCLLTNKEYGLLVLFIQNKNIALFKESLYEKVWGEEYDGDSRTLELHVQRLRKIMGWENQLVAVYKVGYRLEIA